MSAEDELIRDELKNPGANPSKVARLLGLDLNRVRALAGGQSNVISLDNGPANIGRETLRPYIVAVKQADGSWPIHKWPEIERAQRQYDDGTHEMFQGRDGIWIILYCRPRRKAVAPRTYFKERSA